MVKDSFEVDVEISLHLRDKKGFVVGSAGHPTRTSLRSISLPKDALSIQVILVLFVLN
jgi:hypothetical protein